MKNKLNNDTRNENKGEKKMTIAEKTQDVKTVIHSNGSKWAGESPDSLETLIKVLSKHDLDLERFGAFGFVVFTESNGYNNQSYEYHSVRIHGNFLDVSHVFDIEGQYKNLEKVIEAIEMNIKNQCKRIAKKTV